MHRLSAAADASTKCGAPPLAHRYASIFVQVAKIAKAGIGVEAVMLSVTAKPTVTINLKDGLTVGFNFVLEVVPLPTLAVTAFVDSYWFKFCKIWGISLPCGFEWKNLKTWNIANIALLNTVWRIEIPGDSPADMTEPEAGLVTAKQVEPEAVSVSMTGFKDDDSDLVRIEVQRAIHTWHTQYFLASPTHCSYK